MSSKLKYGFEFSTFPTATLKAITPIIAIPEIKIIRTVSIFVDELLFVEFEVLLLLLWQ